MGEEQPEKSNEGFAGSVGVEGGSVVDVGESVDEEDEATEATGAEALGSSTLLLVGVEGSS